MSRLTSIRLLSIAFVVVLIATAISSPIAAQSNPSATAQVEGGTQSATQTATPSEMADDDELPVYINITGYVEKITATGIVINGIVINLPPGMTLPAGIVVGKVASLRGNLLDDDTVKILYIVSGYALPTPTTIPPQATSKATLAATLEETPEGTREPIPSGTAPAVGTAAADCAKAGQKLGVVISIGYGIPYGQVTRLRCEGFSFGSIARAYLLVLAGKDEGKNFPVDTVLLLRANGRHWRLIIIDLGVDPDFTIIVFVIDGGRVMFFTDCGTKDNRKKSILCIGGSSGRGNNGNGNGNGDGNGKKGKGEGDDED